MGNCWSESKPQENSVLDVAETALSVASHTDSALNVESKCEQPSAEKDVEKDVRAGKVVLVALYTYNARDVCDLSFNKGDVMYLEEESSSGWWFAEHTDGRKGYVPRNFVAKPDSMDSEEWYLGAIRRKEAEELVLREGLRLGTFLVREREGVAHEYAITVRDVDEYGMLVAKNYRIKWSEEDASFYVTSSRKFHTIQDLIAYYKKSTSGLKLSVPAPRDDPQPEGLPYEDWEIPREQLLFQTKLGSGNFGEVWKGTWRNVLEVAIKMMKPGTMTREAFLGEAEVMKRCDHPNLVKLYAVCTKEEPLYIVTEFLVNGPLSEYLRKEGNTLDIRSLIDICAQIARGMRYLEVRNVVHRDLAARNVLVGIKVAGVPVVKVADFGLARMLTETVYEANKVTKFPIKWTAPEAANKGVFSVKSDVWSYGILLYEIFTYGGTPYENITKNQEVLDLLSTGYRLPMPDCPEDVYKKVMLQCWNEDPEERPSFDSIYHFFNDYYTKSHYFESSS